MKTSSKILMTTALAFSASTPTLAQQPDQAQLGDYYRPRNTIVQKPTPRQLYLFEHGDYYVPGQTSERKPTPRELYLFRHGDYYPPGRY